MIENLTYALQFVTQWEVSILILAGTALGLIFGAIPGLTGTLAIVLLMPITFGLEPAIALSMLSAIYIGGVSGGQISAILLNMPGTSSSIATTFDGHPMAKKGQPGRALTYGIISSFIGGQLSLFVLITVAPLLGQVVLKFQSFEYVLLGIFGLTVIAGLSGRSFFMGAIAALFGLLIATIGSAPSTGQERFTFGLPALQSGIELLPALIGLYIVSQVYTQISQVDQKYVFTTSKMDSMKVSIKEFASYWKTIIRSSLIGIGLGILPGAGGSISNFLAYDQAKKASKHPEKFGTGTPEGIIAPETSNNAVIGGAYVPMLTLGIPGNTATAILLAGLLLHGLNPGPSLFIQESETVVALFASLMAANLMMVLLMYTVMIRFFRVALKVPKTVLLPLIIVISVAGTYNIRYNFDDLWILLIFGFIGYFLLKARFPLPPIIIGLILGPMIETNLATALMASKGSIVPFFTRPISLMFVILIIFFIGFSFFYSKYSKKKDYEINGTKE